MQKIRWGIIGCGDVTEIKSGPAFNKVKNSELIAVMRRNAAKAKDYAQRHGVSKWYSDASDLIKDPDINAIYIATPPSSHEEYTIAAVDAGKPVYVEKPMSVDGASAHRMADYASQRNIKLCVAHYRRQQPLFLKVKQLLGDGAIGEVRFAKSELYKRSLTKEELAIEKNAWRVDPAIAGGGLFHDLAPHQLDLMLYFFGNPLHSLGIGSNQAAAYVADDIVVGNIIFENGIAFNGTWCFNVAETEEKDYCEIHGSKGKIAFSFFEHKRIDLNVNGKKSEILFDPLQHVQQPMIEKVVEYFLDIGANPCSGQDGVVVMKLIDDFTKR